MMYKAKQTLRTKLMNQNLYEFSDKNQETQEQDAQQYVSNFNTLLNGYQDILSEQNQECMYSINNDSKWNPIMNDMRSQIKTFNRKRKQEKDLNFNLSNKKVNNQIYADFTSTLNQLAQLWNGWTGEIEQKIFKNSIVVFEACLVSKNFMFNATVLKNLNTFMENVQHRELSHFMRVIALLVLEVNDKQSFKAMSKGGGRTYINNHIVTNHSLLVNQPQFIRKICEIAISMIDVITCLMECRHETQLRDTIEALYKTKSFEYSGICLDELQTLFVESEFSARYRNLLNKKFIIEYCLKNSSLMELLFILQNLLSGRKKTVIQQELNQLEFVENVLNRLYDILFHKEFNLDEIVSEEDEDSQDICFTARIQLLRLIINFIDKDEDNTALKSKCISTTEHFFLQNVEIPLIFYLHYSPQNVKSSLISPQNYKDSTDKFVNFNTTQDPTSPLLNQAKNSGRADKAMSPSRVGTRSNQMEVELDGISKHRSLLEGSEGNDILKQENYLEMISCNNMKKKFENLDFPSTYKKNNILAYRKDRIDYFEDKGLMHKIIDNIKKLNENCQLRFWLCSCVEAFLRGSHWYFQLFVFETGLLYCLTRQFILNKLFKVNNIQITLDVLGESVKFNQFNTMYLNILLVEEDWIKKVDQRMFKNIVDSNFFLRNMYLTYEQTEIQRLNNNKRSFLNISDKNQNLFKILCETNIFRTLTDLIECVNEDNLGQDNISCVNSALIILVFDNFHGTLQQKFQKITNYFSGKDTLTKFQKVLRVWLDYHYEKVKELYSLEYATRISFYYFKQVVDKFNYFIDAKQLNQIN